jgi:cell division protein FtsI (penicillin-binding protein 3)
MPSKNIKSQITGRSWWTLYLLIALGVLIIGKIIYIQTSLKKELLSKEVDKQIKEKTIFATRGNIYAADGRSLLATSIPTYLPIMVPKHPKQELFDKSIDSLAILLSAFFKDKSYLEYKEKISVARKKNSEYLELGNRRLDYNEKLIVEKFPLFREGPNKGGARFDVKEYRFLPFNNLAMRTIGKLKKDKTKEGDFGIEASFDNYLKGKDGKGIYERIAGGHYKPLNAESDVDAEPGLDLVTSIDVNFQDIVESALRNQVMNKQAKYGTAVIMEVATGEIKAIANLTRHTNEIGDIKYLEDINYAVKGGTDPGSTFKLASMAALLEKANLNLNELAVNCPGEILHNGLSFTCSHEHGNLTVKQVFEKSCNIGIYYLMRKHFGFKTAQDYFEYLSTFRLDKPSGFQLKGELAPYLKNSKSSTFSGTTVPWMSIGYESRITPIQMLTFYNAIVNNGYWVQPIIVKEIRKGQKIEERIEANRKSSPIVSEKTVKKLHKMMEGVVTNGTAKNVFEGECQIAGKTGTSQKRVNGKYKKGVYYTSFIGYFPANKPKYSCLVVIDEPLGGNIYAADVCAPVFRKIADKIYAYDISMHQTQLVQNKVNNLPKHLQVVDNNDQMILANQIGFEYQDKGSGYVRNTKIKNDSIVSVSNDLSGNLEKIMGMTLKDALPILENKGYRVRFSGYGKVKGISVHGRNLVYLILK